MIDLSIAKFGELENQRAPTFARQVFYGYTYVYMHIVYLNRTFPPLIAGDEGRTTS
jgi:hypothetical protein